MFMLGLFSELLVEYIREFLVFVMIFLRFHITLSFLSSGVGRMRGVLVFSLVCFFIVGEVDCLFGGGALIE